MQTAGASVLSRPTTDRSSNRGSPKSRIPRLLFYNMLKERTERRDFTQRQYRSRDKTPTTKNEEPLKNGVIFAFKREHEGGLKDLGEVSNQEFEEFNKKFLK